MRISSCAATRVALLIGLVAFAAAPSRAIPFTLEVIQTDPDTQASSSYSFDETALGCSDTGANSASCSISGLAAGDASISLFDLQIDNDPIISGVVAVDNTSAVTQLYTFIFTLPVAPIGPSSLTAGDVAGGVTDNSGDGVATLSSVAGSAIYTALIDGAPYQTLFPHLTSTPPVGGPYESSNLPSGAEFGTPPFPSQPGPAVATKIGLQYDFSLTGGDSASFTGKFMVIPEPVTAALIGLGLVGLAAAGRRR
jgi:hypothetical protein